ncbi:MAG: alpha/beta fold hydrolase [Acidobacteriota bacterium]
MGTTEVGKDAGDTVIQVNGIDMYVERRSEGAPLLLLHGGGGAGLNWRLIFDSPPDGFELIVPDLRGHGRSTNPGSRVTFRQLALDVLGLLDFIGIGTVNAIGMSMGAKTLLHLATQRPERVEAMVLVSAAPYFPEATRAIMRAAAAATHSAKEWELMRGWHVHGDEQIRALWDMPKQFADNYEDMSFTPLRLGGIRARTLIVHGGEDPLYPVALATEMHAAIPGSRLWVIPDGGHGPIFGDMAQPFRQRALTFLNGLWNEP